MNKPRLAYSSAQLKHNAAKRKCVDCVANGGVPPPGTAGPTPAPPRLIAASSAAAPPPSAAAPDAASWRPGLPWNDACVGPKRLPPLYPGPPGWVRDPPGFLSTCPAVPAEFRNMAFAGFFIEGYVNQVTMDDCWALLADAYDALPGGAEAPRPLSEHAAVFRGSGWVLDVAAAAARLPAECSATKVMATGAYQLDPSFRLPAELPPRRCEKCKARGAAARCLCGEAYCNRQCQARSFSPSHPGNSAAVSPARRVPRVPADLCDSSVRPRWSPPHPTLAGGRLEGPQGGVRARCGELRDRPLPHEALVAAAAEGDRVAQVEESPGADAVDSREEKREARSDRGRSWRRSGSGQQGNVAVKEGAARRGSGADSRSRKPPPKEFGRCAPQSLAADSTILEGTWRAAGEGTSHNTPPLFISSFVLCLQPRLISAAGSPESRSLRYLRQQRAYLRTIHPQSSRVCAQTPSVSPVRSSGSSRLSLTDSFAS